MPSKYRISFWVLWVFLGLWSRCSATLAEGLEGTRPNIIVILTDDQGYGDISAHGNPLLKTPNLDRLHREGLRFTDFHVSPTCSPTRSALLTGRHEFKNGVTHTVLERERLTLKATTLAQVMQRAGYATGIFGKWHLGDEDPYQPNRRGFEETYIHGAGGIGQTYEGSCGDAPDNRYHNPTLLHNGVFEKTKGYCTDLFFDQATHWIDKQRATEKPFFAWISTNAPHDPYIAKASDFAKYQTIAPNSRTAHFFGMVSNIDENVGRLLGSLEQWKLDQNTLVVFMNDNGGTAGVEVFNAGMRGQKGTAWLGGTRASSFWRWPGKIQPADCPALTAHVDLFRTMASLAGAKLTEEVEEQVEGRNLVGLLENPHAPWSDRTLVTHLGRWPKGEDPNRYRYANASLRTTRWHLVSIDNGNPQTIQGDGGKSASPWQLFDLSSDYGETKNVADQNPEVVKDLAQRYETWWQSILPGLVNENAVGPKVNSFHQRYWDQFGAPESVVRDRGKAPNVLFCFSDDWGRYASVYGKIDGKPSINQVVQTPNIDRIAASGVVFRNAFAPCPSCTPCRSSLISGQYFWRTTQGAILYGAKWDSTLPSFPLMLRSKNYFIGKHQKVWSPGEPVDGPFELQKYAYERSGRSFNDFSENLERKIFAGVDAAVAKEELLEEVGANFREFLHNCSAEKPFFFWFGPTLTHRQWVQGSGKKTWGINPDQLHGKLPKSFPDVPEVREDVADYLGEVQALDASIGQCIRELDFAGRLENTVVVLSGDHGMPGVPHGKCNLYDAGTAVSLIVSGPGIPGGRVVDDMVNLMDLAPTFLDLAGIRPPEVMQGRSLRDILESNQSGQVDPARDHVITGRERHVADAREGGVPYPQRALRTNEYLYIRNFAPDRWPMGNPRFVEDKPPTSEQLKTNTRIAFADMDAGPTKSWLVTHRSDPFGKLYYDLAFAKRPAEELYDLRNDPEQMVNVSGHPEYAKVLLEYRQRLEGELRAMGDPRVLFESPMFESPPFSGPLEN